MPARQHVVRGETAGVYSTQAAGDRSSHGPGAPVDRALVVVSSVNEAGWEQAWIYIYIYRESAVEALVSSGGRRGDVWGIVVLASGQTATDD